MEVEYKKDLHHNYMIICNNDSCQSEQYCVKMLECHFIEGILHMERRTIDNEEFYYYDITAKQALNSIFDKTPLSFVRVKQLFQRIINVINKAYEYLLIEDDFILTPELIFMDVVTEEPALCYLSGYQKNIKDQMSSFIEYIMNKVDYNDREAVLLVYGLYAASKEEGYTMDHLLRILENNNTLLSNNSGITNGIIHNQEKFNSNEKVSGSEHSGFTVTEPSGGKKLIGKASFRSIRTDLISDDETLKAEELKTKESVTGMKDKEIINKIPIMKERLVSEEEVPCFPISTYLYTGAGILAGIMIIALCLATKIIYNTYGNQIDYSKLFALLLIILCSEGYLMKKLWNKKNQVTKIVSKKEYVDPVKEFGSIKKVFNTGFKDEGKTGFKNYNDTPGVEDLNTKEDLKKDYKEKSIEEYETIVNKKTLFKDTEMSVAGYVPQEEEGYQATCLLNDVQEDKELILKPVDEIKYDKIIIAEFPFFIGKLKRNVDYCLEKDVVSRYHAKITKEQEHYYITDLNSTNGTFLNSEPVPTYQRMELKLGDEVSFANIRYRFIFQN